MQDICDLNWIQINLCHILLSVHFTLVCFCVSFFDSFGFDSFGTRNHDIRHAMPLFRPFSLSSVKAEGVDVYKRTVTTYLEQFVILEETWPPYERKFLATSEKPTFRFSINVCIFETAMLRFSCQQLIQPYKSKMVKMGREIWPPHANESPDNFNINFNEKQESSSMIHSASLKV